MLAPNFPKTPVSAGCDVARNVTWLPCKLCHALSIRVKG